MDGIQDQDRILFFTIKDFPSRNTNEHSKERETKRNAPRTKKMSKLIEN